MADPRNKVILYSPGSGNPDGVPGLFPSQQYEILSDGYSENYVDGQPSITMRVRTRWPGSYKFVANMLGTATTDPLAPTGMCRYPPAEFPDTDYQATIWSLGDADTAFLGWWCTSAKLVGTHGELSCQDQVTGALVPPLKPAAELISGTDYDPTTGALTDAGYLSGKPNQYGVGFAEYDLTYEPLPYEVRTDAEMATLDAPLSTCELSRYVIRRERFGGNAFTLQPGSLYWYDRLQANRNDPTAQVDSSAVRVFPNSNLTYTWLNVPGINRTAINNCIGKVNNLLSGAGAPSGKFDYRPDWQGIVIAGSVIDGFVPGTLLFEGVSDIVPKITACGQLLYDLTFNFFYRPDGHNKIYRAATDEFVTVVRTAQRELPVGSWKTNYDEADFTTLFTL